VAASTPPGIDLELVERRLRQRRDQVRKGARELAGVNLIDVQLQQWQSEVQHRPGSLRAAQDVLVRAHLTFLSDPDLREHVGEPYSGIGHAGTLP